MECTPPLFYHCEGHITAILQHSFLWLGNSKATWKSKYQSSLWLWGCKTNAGFPQVQLKKWYWVLCALSQHDSAAACVLIVGEMFVTSIERSWLLHLCNSLDQDPTSWPEEGGPERVSWNPWQKAEGKVLIHHLHVFEPLSSKNWRPSSVPSGKKSETILSRIFLLVKQVQFWWHPYWISFQFSFLSISSIQ